MRLKFQAVDLMVGKRRDAWQIAMKVTQDRGFSVVTINFYCGIEEPSRPRQSHKLEIAGANPAPATKRNPTGSPTVKRLG